MVHGSGFRVQGSWVQGSGFRVQGSWFRVQGLGFRVRHASHLQHSSGNTFNLHMV
ncbi:hypothetical protein T484DRAFT_2921702 [Baffinella frigidus]|nr:hypothetical protein T484DRAFT_2921702 [Cryptophyta sp. CCMP2293]